MSKFKVGDKIKRDDRDYTYTILRITKYRYVVSTGTGKLPLGITYTDNMYELVESGDEHSPYTVTLPDGFFIDEAMRKVEIRKEMNIKEFFKPSVHKNVWAIKRGKF